MSRILNGWVGRFCALVLVLMAATACAGSPSEAEVKRLIEQQMGENVKVNAVTKTAYAGLYEVQAGGDIFYTDAKAQYVFFGQIFEAKSRKNLTRARIEALSKVNFADLPLDMAIKKVKGDGKRVIAVFSDPNCGYCKRVEENLKGVDNVTIYTFMYNILSEDSARKSKNIWCAADKSKAWEDWMLSGKQAAPAAEKCADPGARVYELGQKLKVSGTPTIIFSDGTRVTGAIDAKGFEEKFAAVK